MATHANSTTAPSRRSLFAIATAATLLPAAALAAPAATEWDKLISAESAIDPRLEARARKAQAQGMRPDELTMVFAPKDGTEPFLVFRRELGEGHGKHTFGIEAN